MPRNFGRTFTTAAMLGLAALPSWSQGADRVDKTSNLSFSDTVKKVEAVLKGEHMMVVAKIDHQNMLKMVGAKINGSVTIEFGKPDMGKMLFAMNPAVGMEMPHKIYIFETPEKRVVVSYQKASPGFAAYGKEAANMGGMVDMMLEKIATEASK
jgi:uncharacterized protein (DUF302 family)